MVGAVCLLVVIVVAGLVVAGPAGAEVGAGASPTSQAIAADAQFLEYAPPPAQPGVVCLVDSGVDPNPDTVGALVGAEAEIPSWGAADGLAQVLPRVEGHLAGHGTEMAMLMAAPQNGWGMVGIAPTSVRVYSIRVVPPGETLIPFINYSYAITRCLKLHLTSTPNITVVNLSIAGTSTVSPTDVSQLADTIDTTRQHGLNVVAAAGNDLPTVYYPAAYGSVLSVGAGDVATSATGVLCSFSNGAKLDIIAPGCDSGSGGIDQAFEDDGAPALGYGTSQAAALTSAALAAMRAYSPALGVTEAELCLTHTEQNGGSLDVARAFDACGLGAIVQAGLAATPSVPAAPSDQAAPARPASGSTGTPAQLSAPRLGRLRLSHGRLAFSVLNRPRGAVIQVRVFVRRGHRLLLVVGHRCTSNHVSFVLRAANAIAVRFVAADGQRSAWTSKVIV